MNSVILTGRIKKDILLKESKNGNKYCNITLETDPRFKDKVYVFNILCWYNVAIEVSEKLNRKDRVCIEGYLKANEDGSITIVGCSFSILQKSSKKTEKEDDNDGINPSIDENEDANINLNETTENETDNKSEFEEEKTTNETTLNNPFENDLNY